MLRREQKVEPRPHIPWPHLETDPLASACSDQSHVGTATMGLEDSQSVQSRPFNLAYLLPCPRITDAKVKNKPYIFQNHEILEKVPQQKLNILF